MLSMLAIMAVVAVAYAHPDQLVDTAWVAAHGGDANRCVRHDHVPQGSGQQLLHDDAIAGRSVRHDR